MSLKARLTTPGPAVHAPGAFDALSALLIQQTGFEAVYLSGASIAYTQLGRPDLGLVSFDHVADVVARICERVDIPLIVDADTGFGNALNVARTVKIFERNGARAIQLEDQTFPKRCGHLAGKGVTSTKDMVGKIHAALDAKRFDETLIIARTDAIAVEGFEPALERAVAYAEAGADVVFVEAPRDQEQMKCIVTTLGRTPAMANMVEGGKTPILSRDALGEIGFRLVISPGALVRALIPAAERFLRTLGTEGSTVSYVDRMTDLAGVNARIGLEEMLALGDRYEREREEAAE
ncbi:MAG: oxaloacetate decarboxylase [Brevundimonas sp.]|uniref:isocitrate lyase/PEP mutase family protein n=1 Tax=Brevundimonas sp. TaxID=1871086 RepID=UPI00391F4937